MLIFISPAKTLDMNPVEVNLKSEPEFLVESKLLLAALQNMSVAQIKTLLDVSDDIARLNHGRYKGWDEQQLKQAVLAFDGPAYRGLRAAEFSPAQRNFAQHHLRLLSGFYGLLRPYDEVRPYRLDMGRKLSNPAGKDLYSYWREKVTSSVNREVESQPEAERFVVNCASKEYWKCVDEAALRCPVYTMSFPGPAVYAKQARGAMARFAIASEVVRPEQLKGFTGNEGEWKYDEARSSEYEYVFSRSATIKAAPRAGAKAAAAGNGQPPTKTAGRQKRALAGAPVEDAQGQPPAKTAGRQKRAPAGAPVEDAQGSSLRRSKRPTRGKR